MPNVQFFSCFLMYNSNNIFVGTSGNSSKKKTKLWNRKSMPKQGGNFPVWPPWMHKRKILGQFENFQI